MKSVSMHMRHPTPIFFLCSVLKLHHFLSCFTFLHGLSEFNVFIVGLATAHQIYPRKKGENFRNMYLKIAKQIKYTKSCLDVPHPTETDSSGKKSTQYEIKS